MNTLIKDHGEVVTFECTTDGMRIQHTVKKEWIEKNPDYLTTTGENLLIEKEIMKAWHNPSGPAVAQLDLPEGDPDKFRFLMNGEPLLDDRGKQMEHNWRFGNKIDVIINEE